MTPELAATLEQLGYSMLWLGGSPDAQLLEVEQALDATSTILIATGIVNIWKDAAEPVAASYHRIEKAHPGRFYLGIGVGHVEATGERYRRPYEAMVEYLDELDAAEVPTSRRVLAALGPRMLRLSAERSAGAHPYLVPAEHSRRARAILGEGVLLAPEHKVVLDSDATRARAIGRPAVETPYLGLVNYTNNLRSLGFDDSDLVGGASDRLVDAVVAHGTADEVVSQLTAHLDAGADHVAVNLLTAAGDDPVPGFTALAHSLFD
jgi:probable F420-dependent oxidoreductase